MSKFKEIIAALILLFYIPVYVQAQNLKGTIQEVNVGNIQSPIQGANIRWLGTSVGTTSDVNGNFLLEKSKDDFKKIVVSFIGYKSDTIEIKKEQHEITIILSNSAVLDELVIKGDMSGVYFSKMKPISTQVITSSGLQKAACCNLSESFQNSATVDVNYTDAVTGAKQIQMLGLAGVYSQILTENIPSVRGLSTPFGLGYVPGSWMESIQISKGTASVINGNESITGQLNVEYKNPEEYEEKLFLNLYGSDMGKAEGNLIAKIKVGKNAGTILFAHAEKQFTEIDHNHDSFLDHPLLSQINIKNSWNYDIHGLFESKSSLSILSENRTGGQIEKLLTSDSLPSEPYNINIKTNRYQFSTKNGFLFKKEGRSIGTIISGTYHNQNSVFGMNKYSGIEKSLYLNLIYADIIGNTNHKINTGLSYMIDNYAENLNDSTFKKTESLPGVFAQYTYSYLNIFTAIAGIRADYNNLYGKMITPRIHLKYTVNEKTSFRSSFGKGYRIANIFPENSSLLASSRKISVTEKLIPEEAWNYGVNISRSINISKKEATLSIDYYRTDFVNQVVVDVDKSPDHVYFYNLTGKSYSNSFQIEFNGQPFKRFEVIAAVRYNDVKMTIGESLVEKPFVSKYKGILALSYGTNLNKWKFDATLHYNGTSRIPDTRMNPAKYRLSDKSPAYIILFAQVTKKFKVWDVYFGAENITNYIQKNPVLAADDPYGKYFDTSMIWGPITGRMIYAGIRYKITD